MLKRLDARIYQFLNIRHTSCNCTKYCCHAKHFTFEDLLVYSLGSYLTILYDPHVE